jgi:hypothetical protein
MCVIGTHIRCSPNEIRLTAHSIAPPTNRAPYIYVFNRKSWSSLNHHGKTTEHFCRPFTICSTEHLTLIHAPSDPMPLSLSRR